MAALVDRRRPRDGAVLRGTSPAIVGIGVALYLLGLDAVEPLSQEIDHPDHTDGVPDRPGLADGPPHRGAGPRHRAVRAPRARPRSPCSNPTPGGSARPVRAGDMGRRVGRGDQHRARRARPAGAADGALGRRPARVRRVHVDDPAAVPDGRSAPLPGSGARRARAARRSVPSCGWTSRCCSSWPARVVGPPRDEWRARVREFISARPTAAGATS